MKQGSRREKLVPAIFTLLGLILSLLSRGSAIADNADSGSTMVFALCLILTIMAAVALAASFLPGPATTDIRRLTMAAMFAALCYVGFAYLRIDIPVGTEKTAFHLGNVFCVLGALFLGGLWGGMAGAVGLTIADLTSGYVTSAPKTFLLKLGIGIVTGLAAHHIFHISREKGERRGSLPFAAAASSTLGMAFNVLADPLVGYFYKTYVLGIPQEAAQIWAKIGAITTLVNAVVAVIVATILYLALRTPLEKSRLMPKL